MKKVVCFLMLLGCFSTVIAQSNQNVLQPQYSSPSRWTFGGSIGMGGSFGSNSSYEIYVAPRVGYMLTPQLNLSGSVNYTYRGSKNFSANIFGVGPELSYYFHNFYASTEYQYYYVSSKNKNTSKTYTIDENALYVGAGYRQPLGTNAYMHIGLKYNVLYNKDKSIFASAFVPTIGVVIGI